MGDQVLAGVRVLELCGMVAGPYCGKLLADLGADVVKVEPPGGDPARHRPPFAADQAHPERSLLFLYLNTNKRSVTLDLTSREDQQIVERLVKDVDILIEDLSPAEAEKLGLDYPRFQKLNPGLVMTSITPFGRTGPYRDYKAYPLNTWLAGGEGYLIPPGPPEDLDRPPVRAAKHAGEYAAGLSAAVATLGALYWQRQTGLGQHIDVSKQEALVNLAAPELHRYPNYNLMFTRALRLPAFAGTVPCKDGYVAVLAIEDHHWAALVELMGGPSWATEEFKHHPARVAHKVELLQHVAERLKERSKAELFQQGLALGCVLAPYNTTREVCESPQMAARRFFTEVDHPVAGRFLYPTVPYRYSETPVTALRPAPLLGQDNALLHQGHLRDTGGGRSLPLARAVAEGIKRQPLAGIRVLDFAQAGAGALIPTLLSYFGAEAIKVESRLRLDISRRVTHPVTGRPLDADESWGFFDMNHNKLSVSLNLKHPAAVALVTDLVRKCDVVVENFRPGVLQRLGLDYSVLSKIRSDLIMLSSSAMGQTGPHALVPGYAPTFSAVSGFGELTGYPNGSPADPRIFSDCCSALTATFAIVAALHHRQRTGQGQYIDLSSTETHAVLVGDSLLDYAANGRVQRRTANRDETVAPHNAYRCRGQDRWISIVVGNEEEWQAFRQAMGDPEWARQDRFKDMASRWQHQEELDRHIESWTEQFDSYDLMHRLQAVGVAAVPVFTAQDLFTDPHLAERGLAHVLDQPRAGKYVVTSPPWKLSATPARIERHAPLLGEHNTYVFRQLIGLSEMEVQRLADEGAVT